MPLNPVTLNQAFQDLFADPPDSADACADAWAQAATDYLSGLTQLQTAPDLSSVKTSLKSTFSTIFTATPTEGSGATTATLMEAAFSTLGLEVMLRVTATGIYVATAPLPPVGFSGLFGVSLTHEEAASKFSTAIDTWARTGTTTLIATPFTVSPWI